MYILKKSVVPLSTENYKGLLTFGLMSPSPLQQLSYTIEQVTLMCCPIGLFIKMCLFSLTYNEQTFYTVYFILQVMCSTLGKQQQSPDVAMPAVPGHHTTCGEDVQQDLNYSGSNSWKNNSPNPNYNTVVRKSMH